MSIETTMICKSIYEQIKNDITHLEYLRKNLKEADGRYYITGLSACVSRRLFKELMNKRIVEEKRFVYVNHSVHAWEINYEKLVALIITKMNDLVVIEF